MATVEDARAAALLDALNTEFGDNKRDSDFLARRLATLIAGSETKVFLGGPVRTPCS